MLVTYCLQEEAKRSDTKLVSVFRQTDTAVFISDKCVHLEYGHLTFFKKLAFNLIFELYFISPLYQFKWLVKKIVKKIH